MLTFEVPSSKTYEIIKIETNYRIFLFSSRYILQAVRRKGGI